MCCVLCVVCCVWCGGGVVVVWCCWWCGVVVVWCCVCSCVVVLWGFYFCFLQCFETEPSWQHRMDYNTTSAGRSELGATPADQVSGGQLPPLSKQGKRALLKLSHFGTSFPTFWQCSDNLPGICHLLAQGPCGCGDGQGGSGSGGG